MDSKQLLSYANSIRAAVSSTGTDLFLLKGYLNELEYDNPLKIAFSDLNYYLEASMKSSIRLIDEISNPTLKGDVSTE